VLALKTSNQRGGHPAITAFGSLALLNKVGVHRNSPWQVTQNVACCGAQTADGRLPPLRLRYSAWWNGTLLI